MVLSDPLTSKPFASRLDAAKYVARKRGATLKFVRKEDGDAAGPASTGLRANFVAPLVINVGERIGMQKVINRLGCEITLRAQG